MILLDVATKSLETTTEFITKDIDSSDSKVSFLDLLKGISQKDEEPLLNTSLNINKDLKLELQDKNQKTLLKPEIELENKSSDNFLSLLKNEPLINPNDTSLLNPKITKSLSINELKTLIVKAKVFLKNKILETKNISNEVKFSKDGKEFSSTKIPKSLKGLISMANNLKINLNKITLQEIQKVEIPKLPNDLKLNKNNNFVTNTNSINIFKNRVNLNEDKVVVVEDKHKSKLVNLLKNIETKKDIKPEIIKNQEEFKKDIKPEIIKNQEEFKKDIKPEIIKNQEEFKKDIKPEIVKSQEKPIILKDTNLSRMINLTNKIQKNQNNKIKQNIELKEPIKESKNQKIETTLKSLLFNDKADIESSIVSKVTSTISLTDKVESLESLLKNQSDGDEPISNIKLDSISINKSESLEVKINEAKQMVKYISQDIKEVIDDYKSPFTRIKLQLNPEKLGEVDLTIVQRGKNLHLNLSSNNSAINTLALNINDLRVQLTNNGINNATFNFNNQSENTFTSDNQQQNQQNGKKAEQEYNYFESTKNEEEEILSSLEIVVPHYA